jgi:hypothetical protein
MSAMYVDQLLRLRVGFDGAGKSAPGHPEKFPADV